MQQLLAGVSQDSNLYCLIAKEMVNCALWHQESVLVKLIVNSSNFQNCETWMWPDMLTSVPTPSFWCNHKKAAGLAFHGGCLPM